jgi:hypothetical protein
VRPGLRRMVRVAQRKVAIVTQPGQSIVAFVAKAAVVGAIVYKLAPRLRPQQWVTITGCTIYGDGKPGPMIAVDAGLGPRQGWIPPRDFGSVPL